MCSSHSFWWNVIGERPHGILFPLWYFEAEACISHQAVDMGSGHCLQGLSLAYFLDFRGGAGQVFDLKSITP